MGSPSGRVPERAPERFLVSTKACGSGTSDLSSPGMFLGYVGLYRRKKSVGRCSRGPRDRGARPPLGAPYPLVGPSRLPRPTSFAYISLHTLKTSKNEDRLGVPPPQASVATKNLSGARSGTLPEGEPITGGHLHHPDALHDEEGVVHPRG